MHLTFVVPVSFSTIRAVCHHNPIVAPVIPAEAGIHVTSA